MIPTTRRQWLAVAAGGALLTGCNRSEPEAAKQEPGKVEGPLIETHLHLFDPARFPYHANATYTPPAFTLEDYAWAPGAGIDRAIIVHPEPYQDDHSYLEYAFQNEPKPGFFKGTCLFDAIDPRTPERMRALMAANPNRIVALRIHETHEQGQPFLKKGAIKARDLRDPQMQRTWEAARDLELAIQMHFLPYYGPMIGELVNKAPGSVVILDHLSRAGMGTPEQYQKVLELAKLPNVYMKYSGVRYSSKQEYPYDDAKPTVRQAFDAFGPSRMIWGGLGHTPEEFKQNMELFERMFDFASAEDRAAIRGGTAVKLFDFDLA